MIFGEGFLGIALLVLWVFCVIDVITTDDVLVRHLPKLVWLLLVLVLPDLGSIAWLVLGRPEGAGFHLGARVGVYRQGRRPVGPEDSPSFMEGVERKRLEGWEQELRRREQELRRREDGGAEPPVT